MLKIIDCNLCNNELKVASWRKRIKAAGFKYYEVADMAGISSTMLSLVMSKKFQTKPSVIDDIERLLQDHGQPFIVSKK